MEGIREQMNEWGDKGAPFFFLIDFEGLRPQVWPVSQLPENLYFDFNGRVRFPARQRIPHLPLQWDKYPIPKDTYGLKFGQLQQQLKNGNTYLVNLTCSTPITMNWDFEELFWKVRSKYKVWYSNQFICFSPETFVQIRHQHIYTYPVKGTVDASLPEAQERLVNDPKEQAEHATVVDLLRNDLSKVSKQVRVTRYRVYEEIETGGKQLGQVYSEIRGRLPEGFHSRIGDILFAMLPAGSVTGAPKGKTVRIIQAVEQEERGYYTGVFGYFDGKEMDSCVLIRYLDSRGHYHSGGGITCQSNLDDEYSEMINKVYVPVS